MMKQVVVGVVVIVVLALVAIGQRAPEDTRQSLPPMPAFSLEEVASLTVYAGDKAVLQAVKKGGAWQLADADKVAGKVLNALAVDQLLHDLQTMRVTRMASRKTEQFARFSVNDARVTLKNDKGEVLLDVFVGKPATDLRSTYVRLADKSWVAAVDKVLTWQVKRTHDAWLKPADKPKDKAAEPAR